jgi:ADP-ribose pyrophosphatase
MSKRKMKPKELKIETVYEGLVFNVDRATIDDDGLVYKREILEHYGSAVVLPVHENGDVTLIKQYRHPAKDYLIEIPAGTVEQGETPEECAFREIEEETGLIAGTLERVSEFYVSPGFLSEKMHLFIAKNLRESAQNLDDDESIEVLRMPLSDAAAFVSDGTIKDAKTIIGILLAACRT